MSELKNKKVWIFDLDDTLARSKQPVDAEMSDLLEALIAKGKIIAVISGGSFEQFKSQFLSNLHISDSEMEKIFILPMSGSTMYRYVDNKWKEIYTYPIQQEEKAKIIQLLTNASKASNLWTSESFGELIEDRGSQISYSGLGQDAPLDKKKSWDPDQKKRKIIIEKIKDDLVDYDIKIGGKTTIDITKKGINKGFGIKQLSHLLSIPINKMVYFGDALFPGGNDQSALESGIESVSVENVEGTKEFLKKNFL